MPLVLDVLSITYSNDLTLLNPPLKAGLGARGAATGTTLWVVTDVSKPAARTARIALPLAEPSDPVQVSP